MSNQIIRIVEALMLGEDEMLEQYMTLNEPPKWRSALWVVVPCALFFAFIVALIVLSYS